ncbi:MAG: hypothetical protein SNJ71_06505 [Bacteroidales bacterium]
MKQESKKRRLNLTININIFQKLWNYCGINNRRMSAVVSEALEFFFKYKNKINNENEKIGDTNEKNNV